MNISDWDSSRITIKPLMAVAIIAIMMVTVASQNVLVNLVHAETGQGTDIFRVIMTMFGVENTKGDVVTIVTVNNGESSRVKFLETEAFEPVSSNLTSLVLTPSPN